VKSGSFIDVNGTLLRAGLSLAGVISYALHHPLARISHERSSKRPLNLA
jgi:hypothetical protein